MKIHFGKKADMRNIPLVYVLFLGLGFPLFYFVYKFGNPEPLAHDFFQYYWLYKDFDVNRVIAPHNMRLLGAFFVYVFYQLNFYYDTATAFDAYAGWGFLKQVYFNALLFNYLCVVATSTLLFRMVHKHVKNTLLALASGMVFLLGFGTLFYLMMPLTDAFSVLLFLWAFQLYLKHSYWVFLPLALSIFQREYILMAFAVMAAFDYFKFKKRYFWLTGFSALLFFTVYLALRKTLFYTPHLDVQSSIGYFASNIFSLNYPLFPFLKQLMLTLNLYLIYLGLLIYKKAKGLGIHQHNLLLTLVLFFMTVFVSHVAGHGNNCGRYYYLLSPMIIWYTVMELAEMRVPFKKPDQS